MSAKVLQFVGASEGRTAVPPASPHPGDRHSGRRKLIGNTIERIITDAGYRGHNAPPSTGYKVYTAGEKHRLTQQIKRHLRRRAAVEPVGHLKEDHRMGRNYLPTQAAMPSTPSSRRRIMARLLAALAVVGTLVEAVLLKTTIVANRHDQWLIHGPSMLLMVVLWFIIWRIERGERTTNAAPPRAVADQDAVEEIDRRIAAASDAASANIEATAVAGQDAVEEIGRRIAAASDGAGTKAPGRSRSAVASFSPSDSVLRHGSKPAARPDWPSQPGEPTPGLVKEKTRAARRLRVRAKKMMPTNLGFWPKGSLSPAEGLEESTAGARRDLPHRQKPWQDRPSRGRSQAGR